MNSSNSISSSDKAEKAASKAVIPSLFQSATLIAVVTIVSKFLGLIRDQMIAHGYGASLVSDAYLYAFQIPSFSLILLGGLGGPFHTATVSVLSKLIKDNEVPSKQAERIINTFLTLTGLIFAMLSFLTYFFAPQIMDILANQASPELKALAAEHLRWMSPMIFLGGVVGIFYGVANVYHRFFWPSFSPSAINITLILWLLVLGPDSTGLALAISTLLGGILQVALQLPDYFKAGFRLYPSFQLTQTDAPSPPVGERAGVRGKETLSPTGLFTPSPPVGDRACKDCSLSPSGGERVGVRGKLDPSLKTMGELLFPAMIGTTIGQLNIYVAMFFVSQLDPGGWTAIVIGNRLIQLPIGVLTIAMLIPLFPRFSRWVAEGNLQDLKSSFRDGILSLWMASFPIVVIIFLIGYSGVALLFQRGEFTAADTLLVSSVLIILSLSILPYILRDGITRIFYAFNDSKTPLLAGVISIALNAILNALLVGPLGVSGIALSTVIVTISNALILSIMIRRHISSLEFSKFISPTLKMFFASLISAALGWFSLKGLAWIYDSAGLTNIYLRSTIDILAVIILVSLTYLGFLLLFRVALAEKLLHRFKWRRL